MIGTASRYDDDNNYIFNYYFLSNESTFTPLPINYLPELCTKLFVYLAHIIRGKARPAPFGLPHIQLVRLLFSAGTVFFSHNNSARTVFFSQFQPKFCQPNGANGLALPHIMWPCFDGKEKDHSYLHVMFRVTYWTRFCIGGSHRRLAMSPLKWILSGYWTLEFMFWRSSSKSMGCRLLRRVVFKWLHLCLVLLFENTS